MVKIKSLKRKQQKRLQRKENAEYNSFLKIWIKNVRNNLGDEKWAKLLEQKAKELEDND